MSNNKLKIIVSQRVIQNKNRRNYEIFYQRTNFSKNFPKNILKNFIESLLSAHNKHLNV